MIVYRLAGWCGRTDAADDKNNTRYYRKAASVASWGCYTSSVVRTTMSSLGANSPVNLQSTISRFAQDKYAGMEKQLLLCAQSVHLTCRALVIAVERHPPDMRGYRPQKGWLALMRRIDRDPHVLVGWYGLRVISAQTEISRSLTKLPSAQYRSQPERRHNRMEDLGEPRKSLAFQLQHVFAAFAYQLPRSVSDPDPIGIVPIIPFAPS